MFNFGDPPITQHHAAKRRKQHAKRSVPQNHSILVVKKRDQNCNNQ